MNASLHKALWTAALAGAALFAASPAADAQHLSFGGGKFQIHLGRSHGHGGHSGHGGHGWHNSGHDSHHHGWHGSRRSYKPVYVHRHDDHPYDHVNWDYADSYRPIVTFGGYGHVDDLAAALERETNKLCLELYYNYQHNRGFRQTYREAYEILTTAKYIHGLEHAGNRQKIRETIVELDALFHHVQDDVAYWTGHHHRHVSPGGLQAKLERVENVLHHLMDDIGARSKFAGTEVSGPGANPAAPSIPPAPEDLSPPSAN